MTDTIAPAITCPAWCVASHNEDTTFHLQVDTTVLDTYGKDVDVSAYWDEKAGVVGVYVGEREFRLDQLAQLKAVIEVAEQAARVVIS